MEFHGYALPPDRGMVERLGRNDIWRTADGRDLAITAMDTEHLFNVLGYILRNGRALWADGHPRAKAPADGPIVDWLAARPLWLAIVAELIKRGELTARADIFSVLRVRASAYRQAAVGQYSADLDAQESLFLAR